MEIGLGPLERVGLPACVADQHGRIVSWNAFAADFFRLSTDSAVGAEWHSLIRTVRTLGCCALCRARHSLRNGDVAGPVEVTLSISGNYQRVTMVPVPMSGEGDGAIGFLILNPETVGGPVGETPLRARVRHLEDDRIIDELTAREREILGCVVEGFDARGIAAQLGITHATARNYVQRILNKLGAHNKAEAVNLALTYNLLAN